jgi:hypothetical protein
MDSFAFPAFCAVVLGFLAFRQWLAHQQRLMLHRERVVALEKGVDVPPWTEPHRGLGTQGVLLSGLIWLALGLGGMLAGYVIVPQLTIPDAPPHSIWLAGLAPTLVGVAHLIVYRVQRRSW